MPRKSKRETSITSACLQVVQEITDLEWPAKGEDLTLGFDAIKAIFGKVDPKLRNRVFWALDEGPGLWHGFNDHHYKLRITRNTPEAGLFNVLGRGMSDSLPVGTRISWEIRPGISSSWYGDALSPRMTGRIKNSSASTRHYTVLVSSTDIMVALHSAEGCRDRFGGHDFDAEIEDLERKIADLENNDQTYAVDHDNSSIVVVDETHHTLHDETVVVRPETLDLWQNNAVQFPRLIDELRTAIEPDSDILREVALSMDLTPAQLRELLERASEVWAQYKVALTG